MTILFDSFDVSWWPYLFVLLGASLPTNMWRWLGVGFAGRLRDDSEWILLARAIANALVAGVITRLILFPDRCLDLNSRLDAACCRGGCGGLLFRIDAQSVYRGASGLVDAGLV